MVGEFGWGGGVWECDDLGGERGKVGVGDGRAY